METDSTPAAVSVIRAMICVWPSGRRPSRRRICRFVLASAAGLAFVLAGQTAGHAATVSATGRGATVPGAGTLRPIELSSSPFGEFAARPSPGRPGYLENFVFADNVRTLTW